MDAEDAVAYGIIDKVLYTRKTIGKVSEEVNKQK